MKIAIKVKIKQKDSMEIFILFKLWKNVPQITFPLLYFVPVESANIEKIRLLKITLDRLFSGNMFIFIHIEFLSG